MIRQLQFRKTTQWLLAVIGLVIFATNALAVVELSITSSKSPIPFGESATLSISVTGARNVEPPSIKGNNMLEIVYRGPSSTSLNINGVRSYEIRYDYVLQPHKIGKFRIAPVSIVADGETYSTEEFIVEVVKAKPLTFDTSSIARIEFDLPTRPLFVGETFPSKLRMLMLYNASFPNIELPRANGEAFRTTSIDAEKRTESRTVIDGQYWDVFTWDFGITPVKTGEEYLEFTASHTVRLRERSQENPLNNFGFRTRFESYSDKRIDVKSIESLITILPLPTENVPEGFTGAIGQFNFETKALGTELAEGDPVTLSITITGEGNFSQMLPPTFTAGDDFKSYPPMVKNESLDLFKFAGSKTFEYIVIPRSMDVTEIPSLSFTFFDPEKTAFKTIQSAPIPLTISKADESTNKLTFSNNLNTPLRPDAQIDPNQLLPIKIALTDLTARPTLSRINNTITASIVAPAILLSLFYMIQKGRESNRKDLEKARIKALDQKLKLHKAEMKTARNDNKATDFYQASCRILQAALAKQLGCNPASITSNEIDALWVPSLGSDSTKESIHAFFNKVDALRYSGSAIEAGLLETEEKELETILSKLGKKK